MASSKIMAEKRQAASKEQMDLEPKLEVIRTKTKELQGQVRALQSVRIPSHSQERNIILFSFLFLSSE